MKTITAFKSIILISLAVSFSVSCNKDYPCETVAQEAKNPSNEYARIFKDLIITVFSSDRDADVTEISDSFISTLTEQDKLMIGIDTPKTRSGEAFSCISDSLRIFLAPSLYCGDEQ